MNADNWSPIPNFYEPIANGSIDGFGKIPHDKAVMRALNACYRPNKLVAGDPLCTIFIARLDYSTNETMLNDAFSKYGKIKHMRLVRDIITGFSKQYAFIEYLNQENAKKAIRALHNTTLDGKRILVTAECERTLNGWVPRRLGGGFGGKKEAGQLRFGCIDRPYKRTLIAKKHSRFDPDNNTRNLLLTKDSINEYSDGRYKKDLSIVNDSANDNSKDQFSRDGSFHNSYPDDFSKNKYLRRNKADSSKKLSHNRESNYKSNNRVERNNLIDSHRDSSPDCELSRDKFSRRDIHRSSYNNESKNSRHSSNNKEPRNILDISSNNSDSDHSLKTSRNKDYKNRRDANKLSYSKPDSLIRSNHDHPRDSHRFKDKSLSRELKRLANRSKNNRRYDLNKLEDLKVEFKKENIKSEDL